jgi:transcription elongation factor GreA
MAQEIKMSAAGLKAMQEELEYLKTVRRKELAEEIKEARSHGDLSENSEYDEAKNTQGLVENRITELEQMVKNAVIIDESELSVSVPTSPSRWRVRTRPRSTTSWAVPRPTP